MLQLHYANSFDHPTLAPYRTMRAQGEHHQQRIFVAEGEKIVRRLLQTDFTVFSVVLPPKWVEDMRPLIEARPETIDLFVIEKDVLETLTGFSMYQGVLAAARIPEPANLEEVINRAPRPLFLVAVDGLSNAENMGAIVRNCVAFGAQALLHGETSTSPYLRRAVRTSMGTVFEIPVVDCFCLAHTLRQLRSVGIHTVAAHPHTDMRTLSQASLKGDVCIVFGSEGSGISPEVLEGCDEAVAVPMSCGVDSLNAGSAAAVFCYEVARQRGLV
jgi:tRNA G18 (ribose-2'-O)-methylase SpoU